MIIRFTIHGNQKNVIGNPVPYKRLIRGSFRRGDSDYQEWQEYVRACFYRTAQLILSEEEKDTPEPEVLIEYDDATSRIVGIREPGGNTDEKPIDVKSHLMQLDLTIAFKNAAHGDPDNIFKGIADALFVQDKNLYGTFPIPIESARGPTKKGRVDAVLIITNRKA